MRSSLGHLSQVVKGFLESASDQTSPLLIAYSGGPDSKALLYSALEWGKVPLHIAHVDHGWREESREEAASLQREAESLGIPFHTMRLSERTTEDAARTLRLRFFRTLREKIPFQAVLLGHQADDLAETVLKRLFEGANLAALGGMRSAAEVEGLLLWRPLLRIPKSEIEAWLEQRGLVPLYDATNTDPQYLRARMRLKLMPALNELFGKNIIDNLAQLSERSFELEEYLEEKAADWESRAVHGPFGWWIDGQNIPRVELRHLIQKTGKSEELFFTRAVLETVLDWVEGGLANRSIRLAHRQMIVDRGHFFLLAKKLPRFERPIPVRSGVQHSGDWVFEEGAEGKSEIGWRALWKGKGAFRCGEGDFILSLFEGEIKGAEKVPAFLRKISPVLMRQTEVQADFLSGREGQGSRVIKIFIRHEGVSTQVDEGKTMARGVETLGQFNPVLL